MIAYGFSEYGGSETEYFLDIPIAVPGPGQVLIAVHAAGVNPADWKVRSGNRRDTVPTVLPAVLGREVSGTVVRLGTHSDGFSVGDQVFGSTAAGHGAYAQYTVLNAAATAHKPASVSFAAAATLPVAAGTGVDALAALQLDPGDTLLINGAGGGVGSTVVQLARHRRIRVVAVASERKRHWLEEHGALWVSSGDSVVDYVRSALPDGAHALLDLVGGDSLRALASFAKPGALISVADPAAAAEAGGSGVVRDRSSAAYEAVADLVASGILVPKISRTFPLEHAGKALALVEAGHSDGKVVIEVG